MLAIKTTNLTKKYKDETVVNKLNLEIEKGQLFALLGVNGAGKSTTIKMLSCLIPPTSGDAILLGDSIKKDSLKVKEKINVSPQETAVAPNLSVRENLEFISSIYCENRAEARKNTDKIIEEFALSEIQKRKQRSFQAVGKDDFPSLWLLSLSLRFFSLMSLHLVLMSSQEKNFGT